MDPTDSSGDAIRSRITNRSKPTSTTTTSMMGLLLLSIILASANMILYKALLNSFSSPTTNYGFFVGQFSVFLYVLQAMAVSIFIIYRDPNSWKDMTDVSQKIYFIMGLLDGASSTLSAIAGANCSGELQTILNQLIIPITLIGSRLFLKSSFESFQIWGCVLILCGAVVASSDYLWASSSGDLTADAAISSTSIGSTSRAVVITATIVYFVSIFPSAFSNIYKEGEMKDRNLNEVCA